MNDKKKVFVAIKKTLIIYILMNILSDTTKNYKVLHKT